MGHPIACVSITVLRDVHPRQMLLLLNSKFGWEWPGGKVEDGEHVHDAAFRELKEETGIIPPWLRLFALTEGVGENGQCFVAFSYYCVVPWEGIAPELEAVHSGYTWMTVDRALEHIERGERFRQVLRNVLTGVSPEKLTKEWHSLITPHCLHCLGLMPCRCLRG